MIRSAPGSGCDSDREDDSKSLSSSCSTLDGKDANIIPDVYSWCFLLFFHFF